jgi:hypothetical protein
MHTMQPDLYYRALQIGNDTFADGHFYNGGFYDGHELIGQIDLDGTFRYFGQNDGRPTYLEHIAGEVDGQTLTLKDGSVFDLLVVDRKSLGLDSE